MFLKPALFTARTYKLEALLRAGLVILITIFAMASFSSSARTIENRPSDPTPPLTQSEFAHYWNRLNALSYTPSTPARVRETALALEVLGVMFANDSGLPHNWRGIGSQLVSSTGRSSILPSNDSQARIIMALEFFFWSARHTASPESLQSLAVLLTRNQDVSANFLARLRILFQNDNPSSLITNNSDLLRRLYISVFVLAAAQAQPDTDYLNEAGRHLASDLIIVPDYQSWLQNILQLNISLPRRLWSFVTLLRASILTPSNQRTRNLLQQHFPIILPPSKGI